MSTTEPSTVTVADVVAAAAAEWGTYVAAEAVFINGTRAFNAGDPVPVSHVTSGLVSAGQVIDTTKKG